MAFVLCLLSFCFSTRPGVDGGHAYIYTLTGLAFSQFEIANTPGGEKMRIEGFDSNRKHQQHVGRQVGSFRSRSKTSSKSLVYLCIFDIAQQIGTPYIPAIATQEYRTR